MDREQALALGLSLDRVEAQVRSNAYSAVTINENIAASYATERRYLIAIVGLLVLNAVLCSLILWRLWS